MPHVVDTLPRLLRPVFGRHRAWLGELCRIAARMLVDAYAEALPGGRPGLILFLRASVNSAQQLVRVGLGGLLVKRQHRRKAGRCSAGAASR